MSLTRAHSLGVKLHQWIVVDVGHVDGLAPFVDVGVFALHQPTHMREEETPVGVVGVGVRLAELVMHSVVANPIRYVVLRNVKKFENIYRYPILGLIINTLS